MAETLEINQALANQFEPKRMFEWIVEIDGIDAFTAKTFARPQKQTDKVTIDWINVKRHLAGKGEWQNLTITLHDPIDPSAAQKVMDWLRLVGDYAVGRNGYAAIYKKQIALKLLDPVNNVVEKWIMHGVFPVSGDFGSLDYANSDPVEIRLELSMDYATLEF